MTFNLALVGSSTYLGSHRLSSGFNALSVISADGKRHSFAAAANGYMRSEGTFVFALKPLATAERDGDLIHAVIAATAINGAVDDYIEAHGAGAVVGDRIEGNAIAETFRTMRTSVVACQSTKRCSNA